MNFFERYCGLCREEGSTPNGVAKKLGIASASVTQWKQGSVPRVETLSKIAEYFGVTVDYLLTGDETKKAPASSGGVTDDDIKAALFGGAGDVTDEMWDEVRRFAAYVRAREAEKDDGAVQASRGK